MFLATCLAWLERRKRDHHMVALATRDESAAWLASVARADGGVNKGMTRQKFLVTRVRVAQL